MQSASARFGHPSDTSRPINLASPRSGLDLTWVRIGLLTTGLGLVVCSLANALSRATLWSSPIVYWLGLVVIAGPIFYRLTSRRASTGERLAMVLLLALGLYLAKVVRDAPIFSFSDELVHSYNASQITNKAHLFEKNPILEVTPYYPGLEGATSALTTITGLSTYVSGVIVVGIARIVLLGGLFLLFLRVGGSARVAGLATAVYTGNFNFLFWGAQYSYASLALPLMILILLATAERIAGRRQALRAWAAPILLLIAAVTVVHHLSSYAVAGTLAALSLAYWWLRRSWRAPNPWLFAAIATILAFGWLFVVASSTVGYLTPVLDEAATAIAETVTGEDSPRALFQSSGTSFEVPAPAPVRGLAVLAILLLAAGYALGLRRSWGDLRRDPFLPLFALAGLGFFGTLGLRLVPQAWETGNRLSEIFCVGLAFFVASAGAEWRGRGENLRRLLTAAALCVILVGGAISGWPWDAQLSQPMRVAASGETIVSPPLGLAEWVRDHSPDGRYAAAVADSRLLLSEAQREAVAGSSPDIEGLLHAPSIEPWQLQLLTENDLRYVATDRREISRDGIRGYYFSQRGTKAATALLPPETETKFEAVPGVSRIYSNGPIAVFDMGAQR